MSDVALREPTGPAKLWPWPGNIYLILLAAWLFYMGAIATVEDVRIALFGLGGVTVVLLLFGLRAALVAAPRAPATREPARPRTLGELERPVPISQRARPPEKEAAPPVAPTPSPAARAEPAVPPEPASPPEERPADAVVTGDATPATLTRDDLAQALRQIDARINTEKEERRREAQELRSALGQRVAEVEQAASARAEALEARTSGAAGSGEGGELAGPALERQLEPYLKIVTFNNAVNQKLLPRIDQMIEQRVQSATEPSVLMSRLGGSGVAGEGGAAVGGQTAALATELSEARAEFNASLDGARQEREALREEMRSAIGALTQHVDTMREQYEELLRKVTQLGENVSGGEPSAVSADVSELRQALTTIIEQNRQIRDQQAEISARFPTREG